MDLKELNISQILSIIAAIITAIAIYIFYWCEPYVNGISFFKNLGNLFGDPNKNANKVGLPIEFYYFILIMFFLLIASPILQIIGVFKKGEYPIAGCIMPLLTSILILIYAVFGFAPFFINYLAVYMGDTGHLAEGAFPIVVRFEGHFAFAGTYILMCGGVISLIAGIKGNPKFFVFHYSTVRFRKG